MNLVDGREELLAELQNADKKLKTYLATAFTRLLNTPEITYAVQSTAGGDSGRVEIIFERLEQFAAI